VEPTITAPRFTLPEVVATAGFHTVTVAPDVEPVFAEVPMLTLVAVEIDGVNVYEPAEVPV
jgi:hypothetical protein